MIRNLSKPLIRSERRPTQRADAPGLARRFGKDKSGAAALEFALIALPFLAMIICIIEVGVDFLFFSQIDYAAHKAAQEIRSGSVQTRKLTAEQFKTDILCPKLSGFTCSSVLLNLVVIKQSEEWLYWSATSINPATAKWCTGGAADTVLLQVAYPVPLASMIWAGAASTANGVRYYLSAAAFRNDPFGLGAPTTAGC